ncbi:MAG: hypothetical protein JWM74_1093 [Myxococcaceae bacterium]|nr:hypothetical protein [Myxococcaceae bacterium]
MQLRPYQLELVERVNAKFEAGTRTVVMQLGTGGGKTATAAEILRRATAMGYRSNFFAHLDALIGDTHARLVAGGVHAGFIQAGRPTDSTAPVQVCSLQTLHRRGDRPPADFNILDECHRAQSASVRAILDSYPRAALLGLTATPQRGDGKPLGPDPFSELVCGPQNRWLTEHGHLVPCDVFAPDTFLEKSVLAQHPVTAYQEHAAGKRALVFATNVAHAEQLCAEFLAAGFSAACLTGKTSRTRREEFRAAMQAGELLVLIGVGVFIEGWDEPSVECIVLARAFSVLGSFFQAIGRGLRPSPSTGKARCIVLDLRGSVNVHNCLPDDEVEWSIDGVAVKRIGAVTALMRCKECLAIFRPAARCPRCGSTSKGSPRLPTSRAQRLENIAHLPQHERDARYFDALVGVGIRNRGFSIERAKRWASWLFFKKFKRQPSLRAA